MCLVAACGTADAAQTPPDAHALLDVPYMAQPPALCGGAAVAMVLRYWGRSDVYPQDFASLVSDADGGIFTHTLASAVRDRHWDALVVPLTTNNGARVRIQVEIDRGRPLIALIEVAPRMYHYVVIVGLTDSEVVFHDPARAPFRTLPWDEFDQAWAATGRWTMLVLPPDGFRAVEEPAPAEPVLPAGAVAAAETPCGAFVAQGVQFALVGDRAEAEQHLHAATRLCPGDPEPWLELAGLRFSELRWAEAEGLALSGIARAPTDAYAWQIVATSRYLAGNAMGALDAWNRIGEPRVDLITVHGAGRTRQPVVLEAAALEPRQILTAETVGRALRRLRQLPVVSNAELRYESLDGGLAALEIVLDEHPAGPRGWFALATIGARAALLDEVALDVGGVLGAGERASVAWRWAVGRPRVALDFAMPSPRGLPGIVSLGGFWERQSYDVAPGNDVAPVEEARRRVGLSLADWPTSWLRWEAGAALDRLRAHDDRNGRRFDVRNYLAMVSAVDVRLAGDRLAVAASGGWWVPLAGREPFRAGGLSAAWRSTRDAARPTWSAVAEVMATSRLAPLALWPGAGTGQGRSGLLRAHPLVSDGMVTGPVLGRGLARTSLEHSRPLVRALRGRVSIAGFVDAARAWHRLDGLESSRLYVDAGAGLRVHGPASRGGLRVDVARGLRGGGTVVSAGWLETWPR
jgi:hypothetical protein